MTRDDLAERLDELEREFDTGDREPVVAFRTDEGDMIDVDGDPVGDAPPIIVLPPAVWRAWGGEHQPRGVT